MSELNSKARSLIQSIQFADDPTDVEFDRVHAALRSRIGLGIAAAVVTTAAASTGSSAAASTAAGAGTTVASAASGAGIGGAIVLKAVAVVAMAGAIATGTRAAIVSRHITMPWQAAASRHVTGSRQVTGHAGPATPGEGPFSVAPARALPSLRALSSLEEPGVRAAAVRPAAPVGIESPAENASPEAATTARLSDLATAGAPIDNTIAPATTVRTDAKATDARATDARAFAPTAAAGVERKTFDGRDTVEPLEEEIALLRAARSSLRDGRPNDALGQLDESARRFPDGALAEDAAAERVFALCAIGRLDEARLQAHRFLAQHPRSSYAAAVRSSCGHEGAE